MTQSKITLWYVLFFVWYFMGIVFYALTNNLVSIFIGVVGAIVIAFEIEFSDKTDQVSSPDTDSL